MEKNGKTTRKQSKRDVCVCVRKTMRNDPMAYVKLNEEHREIKEK